MKTIILSKALAIEYQKYDLDRIKSKIKHYQNLVSHLEETYDKEYDKLQKLEQSR